MQFRICSISTWTDFTDVDHALTDCQSSNLICIDPINEEDISTSCVFILGGRFLKTEGLDFVSGISREAILTTGGLIRFWALGATALGITLGTTFAVVFFSVSDGAE